MSNGAKYPSYKYILAGLDWAVVSVSLMLGIQFRIHVFSAGPVFDQTALLEVVAFVLGYGALSVFIFQYFNLYKINVFITLVEHTLQVLKALSVAVVGIALLSFFTKASWVVDSRLAVLYFAALSTTMMILLRVIIFRKLFIWLSVKNVLRRNLVIVGAGESGKNLALNLAVRSYGGLNVVGFLDDRLPVGKHVFGGAEVLGPISELANVIEATSADEVVVCLDDVDHVRLMQVVDTATRTGAHVKVSSPLYDVIPSRVFIEQYGDIPVVGISQSQPSAIKEKYKRAFDVLFTAIGLIVLAPFFLVIAVLITLDSPGPVFFRQTRIGKNGVPFSFYKFRSMVLGSDQDESRKHLATQFVKGEYGGENGNASTKIVNESRVTRVGRWLRKTSLDELPQLFNVLRGEMSLVGPRPCLPYEWDHYKEWHKKRLAVTPGCTGMWQVSGRSIVDFEDMVILDLYYIQNSSLLLDLRLLLKTLPIILLGTGAK